MNPSAEVVWRDDVQLWWPAADGDPASNHAFAMNRVTDSDLTVELCKKRRTCVQAGGHVGLWPMRLARSFGRVLSFEVMPGCYEACRRNCEAMANVQVSPLGLGSRHGVELPLKSAPTAGSWRIDPAGQGAVQMTTIDHLELNDCDAIVLDVEGHEVEALTGAAATIARCRPVIHLEELPRAKAAIQAHMAKLRYRQVRRVHSDVIYVPA